MMKEGWLFILYSSSFLFILHPSAFILSLGPWIKRGRVPALILLLAVSAVVKAEQLPIKTYTTAEGLARDYVSRIVQDSRGFLWFCTPEGLSLFDGYTFSNYGTQHGLPLRFVNDVLETRQGVYWVATGGGLCRFNPAASAEGPARPGRDRRGRAATGSAPPASEPRFVVYRPSEDARAQFINVLIEDRAGTIWCGTRGGLFRFAPVPGRETFQRVDLGLPSQNPMDTFVNALLEDRRGALWVGTERGGLYRLWPDGRREHYATPHGLPSDGVRALREDRRGSLWVGTHQGLCRLVPEPDPSRPAVAQVYTTKDGLSGNDILSLFQSKETLWVGTTGGLSGFTPSADHGDRKFQSYTTAHGLSDTVIWSLAEDRDGNLWVGTERRGVMKIAWNGFTTYRESAGLGHIEILSIFENRAGELCVVSGTPSRYFINRFDGSRFTAIKPRWPESVTRMSSGWYQTALHSRAEEWWLATADGLCRFSGRRRVERLAQQGPQAVYTARDGLPGDHIFRLYEDARGDIWISTSAPVRDTLTRWERTTGRFHRYSVTDGLPAFNEATAFGEDRLGNLWIGFYWGGLARYRDGRFALFTEADGLPAGLVTGLYLDRAGRLWIATSRDGVARLDDPGSPRPRWVTYTTAQGLASNNVRCITEDLWGRLYMATGRGLDRLEPETGRIKHFTTADGLAHNYVSVAFRDRRGQLWFGTTQGLSRLTPEPDRPRPPPPVLINGVRINGAPHPVSALGETEVSGLVLAADQNQVQIDFLGLGMGEWLRYQYKLEGADREWGALTDQRSVHYASLSSGTYRFLVRALNTDGVASLAPAAVSFTILPPIWRRGRFLMLAALMLGLVVYAVYRYRVRRLIELERVRTRIATDLHDDIGSSLSRMAVLSEVVKRQIGDTHQESVKRVTEIADTARTLVDTMSDIVWAIDPRRDDLQNLVLRIRQFASAVLEAQGIVWDFRTPPDLEKVKLAPELRRHIFLIFKEAINNIVRHARCTSVVLSIALVDRQLVVEICDNGCGLAAPVPPVSDRPKRSGYGLESMQARAAQLGGRLSLDSTPGRGTRLTLHVPLKG